MLAGMGDEAVPEVDTNVWKLAANGDVDGVKRLSGADGFDFEATDDMGMAPLSWAARNGALDVMRFLLDSQASVEVASTGGLRPLHHTANYSREDAMRLLIEKGADVDATDSTGNTPLHWFVPPAGPCCPVAAR